uniref:Uncharacterized protein n=1 Tax=Zeugodacus cucurbitae TaxID=28588 RepID=A0A0A1WEG0_ZEUCU
MRRLRTSTKAQTAAGAATATTTTKGGVASNSSCGGASTVSTGITPHADCKTIQNSSFSGSGGGSNTLTTSNSSGATVATTAVVTKAGATIAAGRQKHSMDAKLSGDVFKNFEKTGKSELYVTGNNKRREMHTLYNICLNETFLF